MTDTKDIENVNKNLQDTSAALAIEPPEIDTDRMQTEDVPQNEELEHNANSDIDYAAVVEEDLRVLREEFGELSSLTDITELNDPLRYAALRDLGLTPVEAYLATAKRQKKDNRSHLVATRTVSAAQNGSMSESELSAAREIFVGVSDAEIRKLYKRVTK